MPEILIDGVVLLLLSTQRLSDLQIISTIGCLAVAYLKPRAQTVPVPLRYPRGIAIWNMGSGSRPDLNYKSTDRASALGCMCVQLDL